MNVIAGILVSFELVAKVLIIVDAGIEDAFPGDWIFDALAQRDCTCLLNPEINIGCLLLVPLVNYR